MPDLADLFPGYASEWINTKSGRIFARVGGKGPPLLLLHGFSSTHVMWHRVAPHAMCEDYRAGAYADYDIDKADFDAGNKITIPMLALWGDAGNARSAATPLDTWKKWATDVRGEPIDSGHFLTEENPEATARALKEFFVAS